MAATSALDTAPRDVDGQTCALRCCSGVLTPADDGVRVSTPVKRLARMSAPSRKSLAVAWSPSSPTAFFHARCWGAVLRGARLRSAPFVRGGPQAERAVALKRAGGGVVGGSAAVATTAAAAAAAAPALHAVSPRTSCPHLRGHVRVLPAGPSPFGAACGGCGVHGEVWSCLSCGHAGCGRHGCGHGTAHAASSGHPAALGWADLSVWCYTCDAYLDATTIRALKPAHAAADAVRFPTEEASAGDGDAPSVGELSKADESLVDAAWESAELFEPTSAARAAARTLASMLRESTHTVAFTGAGISVSAGIPDYRGTAGIDTRALLGEVRGGGASGGGGAAASSGGAAAAASTAASKGAGGKKAAAAKLAAPADDPNAEAIAASAEYLDLFPTPCHRALTALHARGLLAYVVTQNCDGLHARSGLPRAALTELHGCVFVEWCGECGTEYVRPYCVDLFSTDCAKEAWYVECPRCHFGHRTGRTCAAPACSGALLDTIVNFGDPLHERVCGGLPRATAECRKADVVVCLGSSLTVTPAATLPALVKARAGKLAIVNLQATCHDAVAALRLHFPVDAFMLMLMEELGAAGAGGGVEGAGAGAGVGVDVGAADGASTKRARASVTLSTFPSRGLQF